MSKTLKMIVHELPRTMGEIDHELLLSDLKIALKEVDKLEQQLATARREGWEQGKREAKEAVDDCKVLAMYVRPHHGPDLQEYFYDENLYTKICVCPACTIARKYKDKAND